MSVKKEIQTIISKLGISTRKIQAHVRLYRVQEIRHGHPVYYNADSDTRYGDPQKILGVCYVAASDMVAIAETLQHGKKGMGAPVLRSEIESKSLHQLEAARELAVVDVAELARNTGRMLSAIVESRGQGSEGYAYTQTLSEVVMRYTPCVDGLLYPSRVYPITGRWEGCNLVLFEGRPQQLTAICMQPLEDIELSSGETVGEFLNRLQIPVE